MFLSTTVSASSSYGKGNWENQEIHQSETTAKAEKGWE